jgi:uncharacterized membrane protein YjgN (DUF898 family)
MDDLDRKEPHRGDNPYAYPGTGTGAAAPGAPPPGPVSTGEQRYPVEFTASAGEYFRIWIVNLALTILTLGIYSAWAKVRKKRYFYAHTLIDGDGFEYRGNPVAILKGRIIAVGLFAIYSFAGNVSPLLHIAFAIVLGITIPWLLVRSFAFNAYNSAYRNIRLHFRGTYAECLRLIVGFGLLTVVSLGLLYPLLKARLVKFAAGQHHYGSTQFEVGALTKAFFGAYYKAIGMLILAFFALGIVAGVSGAFGPQARLGAIPPGFVIFMIVIYVVYLLWYAYLQARVGNIMWNAIAVGPLRFESMLRARDLAGIYMVNIIAVIVTLGLATPWAVVRTMRYRAEKMAMLAAGGLDSFVAGESGQISATGEEVGEMFDIDIGL